MDFSSSLTYAAYDPAREAQHLPPIRALIARDLSEPYSIYVYRYFLCQWPQFSWLALSEGDLIGVVVCKLEEHDTKGRGQGPLRGYIAMLAVDARHRNKGIARRLVDAAVGAMRAAGADEVALETEVTNAASLRLYERLGFIRSKKLHRYYLNGNAAYRLVLNLRDEEEVEGTGSDAGGTIS